MKIYGFYFAALIGDWSPIIEEQLTKLYNSPLYKKTNKLYVRVFYNNKNDLNKFISKLNKDSKLVLSHTDKNEFEFGTLSLIQSLSKTENFHCYYFHSKGVSKPHLKENINSWRRYMEYFLIDKHDTCIKELNLGNDAVGVKLRSTPTFLGKESSNKFWWVTAGLRKIPEHFSGNFWWSKSDFIKKLPNITSLSSRDRHECEFWIGYTNGKLKCLHDSKQASYKTVITENYRTN